MTKHETTNLLSPATYEGDHISCTQIVRQKVVQAAGLRISVPAFQLPQKRYRQFENRKEKKAPGTRQMVEMVPRFALFLQALNSYGIANDRNFTNGHLNDINPIVHASYNVHLQTQ